jgi:hypothetical protein
MRRLNLTERQQALNPPGPPREGTAPGPTKPRKPLPLKDQVVRLRNRLDAVERIGEELHLEWTMPPRRESPAWRWKLFAEALAGVRRAVEHLAAALAEKGE